MKKLILKTELQHKMLHAAVMTATRTDMPVSFAVSMDGDGEPNNKPVLTHVVVMSAAQCAMIEGIVKPAGLIVFETIEGEYE